MGFAEDFGISIGDLLLGEPLSQPPYPALAARALAIRKIETAIAEASTAAAMLNKAASGPKLADDRLREPAAWLESVCMQLVGVAHDMRQAATVLDDTERLPLVDPVEVVRQLRRRFSSDDILTILFELDESELESPFATDPAPVDDSLPGDEARD